MIPQQKYQPNQWLKYKFGNGQGISKVAGAIYMKNKGWIYTLINPADQTSTIMIKEADILRIIEP